MLIAMQFGIAGHRLKITHHLLWLLFHLFMILRDKGRKIKAIRSKRNELNWLT